MSDQTAQDKRPSPEALLEQASRETRGHLKVFLGAAPGVGKTYEMLLSAAALLRAGVDVVIGLHARFNANMRVAQRMHKLEMLGVGFHTGKLVFAQFLVAANAGAAWA